MKEILSKKVCLKCRQNEWPDCDAYWTVHDEVRWTKHHFVVCKVFINNDMDTDIHAPVIENHSRWGGEHPKEFCPYWTEHVIDLNTDE
jgi:hypothetical protein